MNAKHYISSNQAYKTKLFTYSPNLITLQLVIRSIYNQTTKAGAPLEGLGSSRMKYPNLIQDGDFVQQINHKKAVMEVFVRSMTKLLHMKWLFFIISTAKIY